MNLSKARVDPATPDGALSDGLRNHRLNLQPCLEGKGLSWRVCREGELKRVARRVAAADSLQNERRKARNVGCSTTYLYLYGSLETSSVLIST